MKTKATATTTVALSLVIMLFLALNAPVATAQGAGRRPRAPPPPGYKFVAEFKPQKATWLAWGWKESEVRYNDLQGWITSVIKEYEEVHVVVKDAATQGKAEFDILKYADNLDNVFFHIIPYEYAWINDFGPYFINRGPEQAIVDWYFDGWGELWYAPNCDMVPLRIGQELGMAVYNSSMSCEDIGYNNRGVAMLGEEYMLDPVRNPNWTKEDIENELDDFFEVKQVIWVNGTIQGDPSGHIDCFARFIDEDTIVVGQDDPETHPENYEVLENAYQIIAAAEDINGKPFEVVRVPMPAEYVIGPRWYLPFPGYGVEGICPATYTNFYACNDLVFIPQYNDEMDDDALAIFESLFPDRTVIGFDSVQLIHGGGSIGCITSFQPTA